MPRGTYKRKPFTEKHRKKMSKSHSKRDYSNLSKSMIGRVLSEKTKRKISIAESGNKHWNWKGGISFEPYPFDWTNSLKISIRERDDYTCQLCGIHQDELNYLLHCHHIDYNKNNLNPNNLITLCKSCHSKTNHHREYWINYFKNYEQLKTT